MPAPWRILEQTVVMRMPDSDEPGPAMQFTIDPANAAQCRLRIVDPNPDADAYEIVFTTGGLVLEQVYQPRILKPFARGPIVVPPEPVEVADPKNPEKKILVNPLTNRPETDDEKARREALQALKDAREGTLDPDSKPATGEVPKAKTLEQLNAEEAAKAKKPVDTARERAEVGGAG